MYNHLQWLPYHFLLTPVQCVPCTQHSMEISLVRVTHVIQMAKSIPVLCSQVFIHFLLNIYWDYTTASYPSSHWDVAVDTM